MNKILIATLAVLCTLFISCSKQEIDFETTNIHQVETRSAGEITLSYVDNTSITQSITCKEASLTYLNSTAVRIDIIYIDGSTETKSGNNISILPENERLQISTSPSNSFLATDFNVATCNTQCCYNYNNATSMGTGTFFIIEEEPSGW